MEPSKHEHPVIEPAALEQFTRGDESLAREIYGQFLSTTRTDGRNLATAVASGDMVTVQATAHRIKGACRMIGANPTADAAEALEKAGKENAREAVAACILRFEMELERLSAVLERQVQT